MKIAISFPFEELRTFGWNDGDYFDSVQELLDKGYEKTQIWSVVSEGDCYTTGPSRHYINRLGYIATKEHHDNNTYYEEKSYEC